MQTFFVTYNTGQYDSYYEHVYAIDAESKEALYIEIDDAYDTYLAYHQKLREEREKVDKYRPTSSSAGEKQFKQYNDKLYQFLKNYPYKSNFTVYGYEIAAFDEIMIYEKDEVVADSNLEIHSVDEYIEFVRPTKRM